MSKIGFIAKATRQVLKDHSPTILTGLGVSGLLTSVVLAVRATSVAVVDIQQAESERVEPLTGKEKVQLTWRHYIPTGLVVVTTGACVIGANSISSRRTAALVGLYTVTERAYSEYRDKVIEVVGENKEAKVRDAVAQDKVAAAGPSTVIISQGNQPCFDTFTGRFFESTVEKIKKAENEINRQCINDMYASQNDFYRLIGLPPVAIGEEVGWTTDNVLDIKFSAVLEDGKPVMSLEYHKQPKINFHRVWG